MFTSAEKHDILRQLAAMESRAVHFFDRIGGTRAERRLAGDVLSLAAVLREQFSAPLGETAKSVPTIPRRDFIPRSALPIPHLPGGGVAVPPRIPPTAESAAPGGDSHLRPYTFSASFEKLRASVSIAVCAPTPREAVGAASLAADGPATLLVNSLK